MNAPKQPARMGRPPRFPDEGPRIGHSLRLKPSIDKALREAAEKNNRSLAEEMEHRINVSFERDSITYGSVVSSERTVDLIPLADVEQHIEDRLKEASLQKDLLEVDRQLSFSYTKIFLCITAIETTMLRERLHERDNTLMSFFQNSALSKKFHLNEIFSSWSKSKSDLDVSVLKLQKNAAELELELANDERDALRERRKEILERMKSENVRPWSGFRKRLLIGEFLKKIEFDQEKRTKIGPK